MRLAGRLIIPNAHQFQQSGRYSQPFVIALLTASHSPNMRGIVYICLSPCEQVAEIADQLPGPCGLVAWVVDVQWRSSAGNGMVKGLLSVQMAVPAAFDRAGLSMGFTYS